MADVTPEHAAEMNRIATERRKAGRPTWDGTVDLKGLFDPLREVTDLDTDELVETFLDIRAKTIQRFKDSAWNSDVLDLFLREMEKAETLEDFNWVMQAIYLAADKDRIWISTF